MAIALVLAVIVAIFIVRTLRIVPQQHAWVVERLGKFDRTLTPGLNFVVPFIERVAYKHSLKEVPLDVPSQVCITKDNTQLQVDGIIYFQITDPMRASYGSSNYIAAITQLAQTLLRSVIGKMELDKTFEERDAINASVVNALDDAAVNWGVKVLRYEIKDLTPPSEILRSMQAQITAEREKRALIAASEGRRQEQINIATGEREGVAVYIFKSCKNSAPCWDYGRMVKVHSSLAPFLVFGGDIVGHKNHSRRLPDQLVFLGIFCRNDHSQRWASIRRSYRGPSSAGEFDVGNESEA